MLRFVGHNYKKTFIILLKKLVRSYKTNFVITKQFYFHIDEISAILLDPQFMNIPKDNMSGFLKYQNSCVTRKQFPVILIDRQTELITISLQKSEADSSYTSALRAHPTMHTCFIYIRKH